VVVTQYIDPIPAEYSTPNLDKEMDQTGKIEQEREPI
jgi:hypothetical protein